MKRALLVRSAAGIAVYVILSSVVHYGLLPIQEPDPSDLPRNGTVVRNEGIRSQFIYRRTSIETGGQLFEWDNLVEPGGGPINIPHIHPLMVETFKVMEGEIRFVIDGKEIVVGAGSEIAAQPGSAHAFQNVSSQPARMISRLQPAKDGPWEDLARRGVLIDSQFVQFERKGGLGRTSTLQGLVFLSRYKQGYLPGPPLWLQDTAAFLIAPTARLFGVRAYYPPVAEQKGRP